MLLKKHHEVKTSHWLEEDIYDMYSITDKVSVTRICRQTNKLIRKGRQFNRKKRGNRLGTGTSRRVYIMANKYWKGTHPH